MTAVHASAPVGRPRQRLSSVRVAIALCVALLLALAFSYASLLVTGDAGVKQTDFMPLYTGARMTLHGQATSIYHLADIGRVERAFVAPLQVRDGVMPYLYPPFVAAAMAPLGGLGYNVAFGIWLGLNGACLVLSLFLLCKEAALKGEGAVLFWVVGLSFLPVFVGMAQGQTSLLVLAALTVCLGGLRAGRPGVAGVALAVVLIKPPYVLPILLVLALRRDWRPIAWFCGAALVLLAVPVAFLGPGVVQGYWETARLASGWQHQYGFAPQWNHSFAGFAELLLGGGAATALTVVLDLGALGVVVWSARRSARLEAPFGVAVTAGVLVNPHALIHDLSLVLIPVAILLMQPAGRRQTARLLAAGYLVLLIDLRVAEPLHVQFSVGVLAALLIALAVEGSRPRGILRNEAISMGAGEHQRLMSAPAEGAGVPRSGYPLNEGEVSVHARE